MLNVFILLYCCFLFTVFGNICPDIKNVKAVETINYHGKSSYSNAGTKEMIYYLEYRFNLNKLKPVLDLGCGFGNEVNALLMRGFANIYAIDKSFENIQCMKEYLRAKYSHTKLNDLHFYCEDFPYGDFNINTPDNFFQLAIAKNVIHFLNERQLVDFLEITYNKLSANGVLLVAFETSLLNEVHTAEYSKIYADISLIDNLKDFHNRYKYHLFHTQKRKHTKGYEISNTLISPQILLAILRKIGFKIENSNPNRKVIHSYIIIATKPPLN